MSYAAADRSKKNVDVTFFGIFPTLCENPGNVIIFFRYVDDYLVLVERASMEQNRAKIIEIFGQKGNGLRFTHDAIRMIMYCSFLMLSFHANHLCWYYCPRSRKPILGYSSSHPKVIKSGTAVNLLNSAVTKSCYHKMACVFPKQITRLQDAGFLTNVLVFAAQKVLRIRKKKDAMKRMQQSDSGLRLFRMCMALQIV